MSGSAPPAFKSPEHSERQLTLDSPELVVCLAQSRPIHDTHSLTAVNLFVQIHLLESLSLCDASPHSTTA